MVDAEFDASDAGEDWGAEAKLVAAQFTNEVVIARWHDVGFSAEKAAEWVRHEFEIDEALAWTAGGYGDGWIANRWRNAGFTVEEVVEWDVEGVNWQYYPEVAGAWHTAGFDAEEAEDWRNSGFNPEAAGLWIAAGFDVDSARMRNQAGFDAAGEPVVEAADEDIVPPVGQPERTPEIRPVQRQGGVPRCRACHRPLRSPESVVAGIGPTCAGRGAGHG